MQNFTPNGNRWSDAERAAATASFKSLYSFFRNFWGELNSDPYTDNWHVKYLCDRLQRVGAGVMARKPVRDLHINVPPGSSKSTIASQMFPAWLWLHAPWCVMISSSYDPKLSESHALKSRTVINSAKYQEWFGPLFEPLYGQPMVLTKENMFLTENNHGGQRWTVGTSGKVTGRHAHIILRDDPVDPFKMHSDPYRKKDVRFNDQTLPTRKKDPKLTPTVTIMQRVHASDPTGRDLRSGIPTDLICLPAMESGNIHPPELAERYVDGLLDANRLDLNVLEMHKRKLGSYTFAGQFQQRPSPEGGGQFQRSWFRRVDRSELPNAPVHFAIDPAYTTKKSSDYTAILAYRMYAGRMYVQHAIKVRKTTPELQRFLVSYCKGMPGYTSGSKIIIEPAGNGQAIIDHFTETGELMVVPGASPTTDKVTRAEEVNGLVEAGRVAVVIDEEPWPDDFFVELEAFPNGDHDDMVDALIIAMNAEFIDGKNRFFTSWANGFVLRGNEQLAIDPNFPLYIAVEFDPYHAAALVFQIFEEDRGGVFFIAEHKVLGDTSALAPLLAPYKDHPHHIFINGDYAYNKESTVKHALGGGQYNTQYMILLDALALRQQFIIDTRKTNHRWVLSRTLVNFALEHRLILVNEACENLIIQLSSATADDKGELVSSNAAPNTLANCFRYSIHSIARRGFDDLKKLNTIVHES